MKKNKILTAVMLSVCMGILPIQALPCSMPDITANAEFSEEIEYNGITFAVRPRNENELAVISYNGNDENLVIPETVGGKTVTAIENEVFYENKTIVNVTLPDTIDYFGFGVFALSYIESIIFRNP